MSRFIDYPGTPSEQEVERCIEVLEIADPREQQAIRNCWKYQREKRQLTLTWRNLLRWAVLWRAAIGLAGVAALLWLWP